MSAGARAGEGQGMAERTIVLHLANSTLIGVAVAAVLESEHDLDVVSVASSATGADLVDCYGRHGPDVVVYVDTGDEDRFRSLVGDLHRCDPALRVALVTRACTSSQLDVLLPLCAAAVVSPSDSPAALQAAIWSLSYGSSWFTRDATGQLHDARSRLALERTVEVRLQALTRREREILMLLGAGLSNREMARQFVVAERTVRFHLRNLFDKLGLASRAQAVAWAHEAGLTRAPRTGQPPFFAADVGLPEAS